MKTQAAFLVLLMSYSLSAGQRVPEQPLRCGGPGYTATYSGGTNSVPPMVDVTFRATRPTSAAADTALRKCIKLAARYDVHHDRTDGQRLVRSFEG